MITPEQRRKLEASLSPEDRSLANNGRLFKAVVLMVVVLGVTLIGARGNDRDYSAATIAATHASPHAPDARPRPSGGD